VLAGDRVDPRGIVAENSTVCRSLGRLGEDLLELLGEAHVEHLVGLVEDDDRDGGQVEAAALDGSSARPGVATTTSTPRSSSGPGA
jgi:hypothetical protein